MEDRLRFLTFIMIAIGLLYTFDGINQGELTSGAVTGYAVSEQPDVRCSDSDNRDYFTMGTTYANLFTVNGEGPKQDVCEGNTLVEYYCVFNEPQVEFYECPRGCVSGRCA